MAKPSKPSPEEQRAAERARLVAESHSNPHAFFSFGECAVILGFGDKAMTRLSGAGAPVVFRKMNPAMVCAWIFANPDKIEKIGLEDENP